MRIGRRGFAPLDDLLCQWVTRTVEVRIIHVLPASIRAGMNLFLRERVLNQCESIFTVLKLGVRLEIKASQLPQPMVKFAFDFIALTVIDPKLLMNLFIEVFKKFLAGLLYALVNLYLHLGL